MLLRRNDGAALSEWWCCSVGMMVLLRRNNGAATLEWCCCAPNGGALWRAGIMVWRAGKVVFVAQWT